ncbi:MAG TPA: phosphoribosyltransferase family protein [Candidatus Binatia bacterium]
MPFRDREEAALLLAKRLRRYRGENPLVLAIPRGAVPMAKIIAAALDGEVDVVLVRKLGAPGQPELAIGSVEESGKIYLSEAVDELDIHSDYITAETRRQLDTLRKRRMLYTPRRRPVDPSGRIVIVVDDGVATGATMIAALRAIRAKNPKRLVAAVAVAPPRTLQRVAREADEVVCLKTPYYFSAVGEFFVDFSQISDEDVIQMLRENRVESADTASRRASALR